MKIYIAGTMEDQSRIRQYREPLFQKGHHVISTWLDEQVRPAGMTEEQFNKKMAAKDLQEISSADLLILDLVGRKSSGKHVEFGFALAKHKLIITVTDDLTKVSTFVLLSDAVYFGWDSLIEVL